MTDEAPTPEAEHEAAMADALGEHDTHAASFHRRLLRAVAGVTAPLHRDLSDLRTRVEAMEAKEPKKPTSK